MRNKSTDDVDVPGRDPAEGSRQVVDHELSRQDRNNRPNSERPSCWPKATKATKLKVEGATED